MADRKGQPAGQHSPAHDPAETASRYRQAAAGRLDLIGAGT